MNHAIHSPTRVRRPARGFTLIELLMVIGLIALLMTVLMPAVFRALEDGKAVAQRAFIYDLTVAAKAYARDHGDMPPAVVQDPMATGYKTSRLSGAQELRLALLGWTTDIYTPPQSSQTIMPRNAGVVDDMTQYSSMQKKVYLPRIQADQLVKHGDLKHKLPLANYDVNVEVFVAHLFSPANPMLYYRKRGAAFSFADNSVYCYPAETQANWTPWATKATNAKESFFILWCGPDGTYFTGGDDHSGLPND
ncbi:MAG: type II secretion system protein [Phycisphaerae bacterium]|nr:type II secretion system protein [Phycisphaerae bacterium]